MALCVGSSWLRSIAYREMISGCVEIDASKRRIDNAMKTIVVLLSILLMSCESVAIRAEVRPPPRGPVVVVPRPYETYWQRRARERREAWEHRHGEDGRRRHD